MAIKNSGNCAAERVGQGEVGGFTQRGWLCLGLVVKALG